MQIFPTSDVFEKTYNSGKPQLVWAKLVADLETPVSAFLKIAKGKKNSFLLESVESGIKNRYSFIGFEPDLIWRAFGQKAEINRSPDRTPDSYQSEDLPTLDSLHRLMEESRIDMPDNLPPMAAGLFGYMGYDAIRLVEDLPDTNPDTINIPDGIFIRPTVVAVFDNLNGEAQIVTPVRPQDGLSAADAYEAAVTRLNAVFDDMAAALPARHDMKTEVQQKPAEPVSNMSRESFYAMVEKAKEYIMAGDIFQVVLGQRFTVPFKRPSFDLYRALRRLNPSPFLFYLNFEDFALVGSSPEILVRVREGVVTVRPIAGTRPRGKDAAEDQAFADDLLQDPKELAEHLMLLDLGRNDVGRVAEIGSVRVTEKMIIEYYSHVMHIVSNVDGDLRADQTAMDALMAGFPAGTVSGAPKIRAMEIIEELEPHKRSFYAGSIGYISANGDMDTCIALRTGLVKDGEMICQAGGGIVADSSPKGEFEESCNKAGALLAAAREASLFS